MPKDDEGGEGLEKDDVKQLIREKMEKNNNSKSSSQQRRDFYAVGQDFATESAKELSRNLLARDYLNLANFDGSNDADVGVIVIPEKHIPKKPKIVDPDNANVVLENNPNDKKLQVSCCPILLPKVLTNAHNCLGVGKGVPV